MNIHVGGNKRTLIRTKTGNMFQKPIKITG